MELVQVKEIVKHPDDRGFLSEVFKKTDWEDAISGPDVSNPYTVFPIIAQANFTVAHPGTIKAFHYHKRQEDFWYCTSGTIQVVVHLNGKTEQIILGEMGKNAVIRIPSPVLHGYRVLGNKPAGLFYLVTNEYNNDKPDEERVPYDDPSIGFDWTTKPK